MGKKQKNVGVPATQIQDKQEHFIPFTKSQQRLLLEINNRQRMELNITLQEIYEELGIVKRIQNAQEEYFQLKSDFSGLIVQKQIQPLPSSEKKLDNEEKKIEEKIEK